jgi:hypothetical protein
MQPCHSLSSEALSMSQAADLGASLGIKLLI